MFRIKKENFFIMNKFKQNTYTCLLLLTCFAASPFIFSKIWKSSEEAKKAVNIEPPSVSSADDPTANTEDQTANSPTNPDGSAIPPAEAPPSTSPSGESADFTFAPEFSFIQGDASYFDDALFIGDSRTVGIEEYGTLTNADYFCSVGMMASQIDNEYINGMSFDQLIDSKQYGKIYLMLGVNEVGNDFQYTLTQYRVIVERLKVHQPNAIIVIQANLHVSASAETNVINNSNINYLNSLIASLADNKKVFYIDINELYDDEYGYLKEAYTSDGVHPLAKYYTQWCEWLCSKEIAVNSDTAPAETVPEPTAEAVN